MDVIELGLIETFSLILVLLGFMGRKAGWLVFPIFGGISSIIGALVLYNDGSLVSGTTLIAAANGNFVSDFNAIAVLAIMLGVAPLIVAMRKLID